MRLWSFPHNFSSSSLSKAKLTFERQFSREFTVLCAMIAQNAYANAGQQTRAGEGTREGETAWARGN